MKYFKCKFCGGKFAAMSLDFGAGTMLAQHILNEHKEEYDQKVGKVFEHFFEEIIIHGVLKNGD